MDEINSSDIEKLKEVFGPLSRVTIEGEKYIFRTLNRKDLFTAKILTDTDLTPEKEEAIVMLALVYPRELDFDNTPAGTISSIAEMILDKSGVLSISSLQDALEGARQRRTIFNEIYEMICCAFPALLPGDLDALPVSKLMEFLVMAENILLMNGILEKEIEFRTDEVEEQVVGGARSEEQMTGMLQKAMEEAQQQGFI